ncbi:hypothetical protein E0Z10_g5008 [Xylaria hypoxylon]|uniref:Uncharacterized protein n=1 Tax=Xylaria hypoxylon TaxID=37992 RepID=A0A4Z0YUY6_9PEZI|nr:hypothetical protein E0Z10_g5008 [Xylaria hypoxylon]
MCLFSYKSLAYRNINSTVRHFRGQASSYETSISHTQVALGFGRRLLIFEDMAEILHTLPAGVGSSASSPSPPQEQLWYEDADISGAYLRGTNHTEEIYLAMQYYSEEAQNSSQALRPVSITSKEECDDGPPDDHIEAHKGMRLIPSGWSLEIAGLFLTLAAFISLLAVLKRVDNRPLSTWQFLFSVNTVISTLSIIMKTPLAFAIGSCLGQGKWSWFTKRSGPLSGFVTFDDASRGPLGCVALLWWLKSRSVFRDNANWLHIRSQY